VPLRDIGPSDHAEDVDVGQTDQQLAHAHRVDFHGGCPESGGSPPAPAGVAGRTVGAGTNPTGRSADAALHTARRRREDMVAGR
jgi:hypothetical protein